MVDTAERLEVTTTDLKVRKDSSCAVGWMYAHRFFESRIGQLWDKVWSEFCAKCSTWWLRRDAWEMVEKSVEIRGGVVLIVSNTRFPPLPARFNNRGNHNDLFVHPRTGQLCGAKSHAKKQQRALKSTVWLRS